MPKRRVSPTKMTLAYLRKRSVPCRVVEQWIRMAKGGGIRRDLFGGDILALVGADTLLVQAGVGAHHAAKILKASLDPDVRLWLSTPTRKFHVWTWTQRVVRNKGGAKAKRPRWTPRATELSLVDGEILASDFVLNPCL